MPLIFRVSTVQRLRVWAMIAAVGLGAAGLRAEVFEQVLFKVNGDIFTKTDLEIRQVLALRQRGQQIDLKQDANNEALRRALSELTPQLVVEAISEMLMLQRGRELGYKLTDDRFKTVLDNIKKDNKIESEEQFQAALKQENMTLADVRKNIEKSMVVQQVQQAEVFGRIAITEEEARKYYSEHMKEFVTPPSITLRELFVAVPGDGKSVSVGLDEEAKAKAERLRARIIGGESFEKLAAELSEAPSKANAGLIGPLSHTELSPDLQKLIEPLKPGDISPIVRASRGYQFFKIEAMTATETLLFDQAREQISDKVFNSRRQGEFLKYLEKLRAQAIIEFKNAEIKKAYDEGLAKQAAALVSQP